MGEPEKFVEYCGEYDEPVRGVHEWHDSHGLTNTCPICKQEVWRISPKWIIIQKT